MPAIDPPSPRPARGRAWVGASLDFVFLYGIILLALVPVGYLLVSSFNSASLGAPFKFSLLPWEEVFTNQTIVRAFATSLFLALRVVPAFIVAFAISWALVRLDLPARRFIEVSLWFAFFLPAVPMVMAWILLLHKDYGLINVALNWLFPFLPRGVFSIHSMAGIVWTHVTLHGVPFLVLVLTPMIRQLDVAYEEAALVSGSGGARIFSRIIGPMLLPAFTAVVIAAFIKGLSSFEIEQLIGTPAKIFIFSTEIYNLVRQEPPLFAQAMALGSLLLLTVLLLGTAQFLVARIWPPQSTVQLKGTRSRRAVAPRTRNLMAALVILYIVISIYLPVVVIAVGSFNKIFGLFVMANPWTFRHWIDVFSEGSLFRSVRNSVMLGFFVAIIALPAYFRLAWITTRKRMVGSNFAALLLWLPWALPGFVFGLSLLDIMLRVDFLASAYGTFVPVIFALFLKELPLAVHFIRSALNQVGPDMEDAAALSGAGRFAVFGRITLPLISSTMVSIFVLVFAAVIQEISTIVLVAAPGTETVSLLMFGYAQSGRPESAAVLGVLFAVLAMLMALFVNRRLVPIESG